MPQIFKTGALIPGTQVRPRPPGSYAMGSGRFDVVFLEAIFKPGPGEKAKPYSLVGTGSATLVFSLAPLDRADFHATPEWAYADFEAPAGESRGSVGPDEFLGAYHADRSDWEDGNELVFRGPVSLAHLRQVWVDPAHRDTVLEQIRVSGVTAPRGRRWEDVVIPFSSETLPETIS